MWFEYCFLWSPTQLPTPNSCAPQGLGKCLECAWGCLWSLSISILARVSDDHHRCCNQTTGKRQEMMPLKNGEGGGVHQVMALALGSWDRTKRLWKWTWRTAMASVSREDLFNWRGEKASYTNSLYWWVDSLVTFSRWQNHIYPCPNNCFTCMGVYTGVRKLKSLG